MSPMLCIAGKASYELIANPGLTEATGNVRTEQKHPVGGSFPAKHSAPERNGDCQTAGSCESLRRSVCASFQTIRDYGCQRTAEQISVVMRLSHSAVAE